MDNIFDFVWSIFVFIWMVVILNYVKKIYEINKKSLPFIKGIKNDLEDIKARLLDREKC